MDWQRVNVWTHTLYTLVHSLQIAHAASFHPVTGLHDHIVGAKDWINPECSFASPLAVQAFGRRKVTFRRDPARHFEESAKQLVKMLVQDLTVIFDEMMDDSLNGHGLPVPQYPQSKVEKLATLLDKDRYDWCRVGCLELIAVRNALTHGKGHWNEKSLKIIEPFVTPLPADRDVVTIGVPMLFRYRKAIRTFLNETSPKAAASAPRQSPPPAFNTHSRVGSRRPSRSAVS